MILNKIKLKRFRNFENANINLQHKSLIIGSNDVGKTNLLWAMRLLLDRSLSDYDLEPKDTDFYAFKTTNKFKITLFFSDVVEDCILSKMKGRISDEDKMVLAYHGFRDEKTGSKSFKLFAGPNKDSLEEIDDRFYRKVLNVKYIASRRDFHKYIKREKNYLFQSAKESRTEDQEIADAKLYADLADDLKSIDAKIPALNYISSATDTINEELSKLSLHHLKQKIVFDASSSTVEQFVNNTSIASKSNDQNVLIGGDGRLNQIYLALWAARNELTEESLKEVSIFCIEEPEAHLHPHQQRKLADYLNRYLKGQVLMTSHSPQIASEFSPNAIVRLLNHKGSTRAASNGCSQIIDEAFKGFGYRMSIIPAEAFFSDTVFLIEGPSEELFYKTLANQLKIDLDRLNISILMVDGIGFSTFIEILNSLEIQWVLRTDNDIFKIPKKEKFRFAGVQRCLNILESYFEFNEEIQQIISENKENLTGFESKENTDEKFVRSAESIKVVLSDYDMFISIKDLESDLLNSEIGNDIQQYFSEYDSTTVLELMQKRKASFMYEFLRENKGILKKLENNDLSAPLKRCKELIEIIQNESN